MANDQQLDPIWSRTKCFMQSWLSMKTWVKAWLWFVNAVFIAALAFWSHAESQWILLAYVATGPLLFGQALWQRGLTRLLGLAHLIPWLPLLVYLLLRLFTDLLGPPVSGADGSSFHIYLLITLATLIICLALDMYDVIRWLGGERYVLGSTEAFRVGASSLAPLHSGNTST